MKDKKKVGRILSLITAYIFILCAVVVLLEDIKGLSSHGELISAVIFFGAACWIIFDGDYKKAKEKLDEHVDYPNLD